jgi:hypothetical protein
VPLVIVAFTNIRIRSREMSIHKCYRKFGGPVVDINVGACRIAGKGYLDGGNTFGAKTSRVTLVIDGVVGCPFELPAPAEELHRSRLHLNIDSKLLVATCAQNLTGGAIYLVHYLDG